MTGFHTDNDQQPTVHVEAARRLAALGPDHHPEVVRQARLAGPALATAELVDLLDRTGALSLSIGAYGDAADLLRYADQLDAGGDLSAVGHRLLRLADAVDGTGDVTGARQYLARAVSLGMLAGDDALVARAAVQYALPVDWYAGDERAAGFLTQAARLSLDPADRVAVTAARALVEMRLPLWETNGQQVAWITRPGVAQPLAEQALEHSHHLDDWSRLLALLAWRSTHRGPDHLVRRRAVSDEALVLAQRLRHASFQVDAGVWLAVDAIEAGDRATYDRTVSFVRWIAERDGNPRLRWRALTLAAGRAMVDSDYDAAEEARRQASTIAQHADVPGWSASDLFMTGQRIVSLDDHDGLAMMTLVSGEPVMQNPIALAGVAYAHARVGDRDIARRLCQRALTRLDTESSLLLVCTRLAATAVQLADQTMARRLVDMLTPYRGHGSVDSNGWWYDGPVDAWLAQLHHLVGNASATRTHAASAVAVARIMSDQRTLDRVSHLTTDGDHVDIPTPLNPRQRDVVRLVAQGLTNAQIAEALHFSVSTIRHTLADLYDLVGVRTRTALIAAAQERGLM